MCAAFQYICKKLPKTSCNKVKPGRRRPVERYAILRLRLCCPFLTHDPAIALEHLLHVDLVHLEGVEVSDKDARVDRVRILRARLISDLAQVHHCRLRKTRQASDRGERIFTIPLLHVFISQLLHTHKRIQGGPISDILFQSFVLISHGGPELPTSTPRMT